MAQESPVVLWYDGAAYRSEGPDRKMQDFLTGWVKKVTKLEGPFNFIKMHSPRDEYTVAKDCFNKKAVCIIADNIENAILRRLLDDSREGILEIPIIRQKLNEENDDYELLVHSSISFKTNSLD